MRKMISNMSISMVSGCPIQVCLFSRFIEALLQNNNIPSPLAGKGHLSFPSPLADEGHIWFPSPLAGEGQGEGERKISEHHVQTIDI